MCIVFCVTDTCSLHTELNLRVNWYNHLCSTQTQSIVDFDNLMKQNRTLLDCEDERLRLRRLSFAVMHLSQEMFAITLEFEERLFVRRCGWTVYYMRHFFPGVGFEHIRNLIAAHTLRGWNQQWVPVIDAISTHMELTVHELEKVYADTNNDMASGFFSFSAFKMTSTTEQGLH